MCLCLRHLTGQSCLISCICNVVIPRWKIHSCFLWSIGLGGQKGKTRETGHLSIKGKLSMKHCLMSNTRARAIMDFFFVFQWVPIIRGFSLFVSRPGPYSPQITLNMFFKKSKWFQSDWVECEQHFSLAKRCSTRFFFVFFCLFDCQQYVTCQTQSLGRDPACRIIFLWHTKATKVCLLHVAKLISSFQRRRKSALKIILGGFDASSLLQAAAAHGLCIYTACCFPISPVAFDSSCIFNVSLVLYGFVLPCYWERRFSMLSGLLFPTTSSA